MESKRIVRHLLAMGVFLLTAPALLSAQAPGKKVLTHEDYNIWKSVGNTTLSNNGEWIAYVVSPREGDGVMTLRAVAGSPASTGQVDRASALRMTSDSRFLVFTIDPMFALVDSLEGEGKRGDDLPKDSLGVIQLSSAFSGGTFNTGFFKADRVKSWKMPAEEGAFLAYTLEKLPAVADSAAAGDSAAAPAAGAGRAGGARPGGARGGGGGAAATGPEDRDKAEGDTLVLRNLDTGTETRFLDVTDYAFTDDGAWLVYTASNEDGSADGVYSVYTASGAASPVLTGEGEYRAMAMDDASTQLAFLTNRDDWEAKEPAFTLFHASLGAGEAQPVATEGTPGIPEGWWVPNNASPSFSDEGTRLLFGTAPRPPAEDTVKVRDDEKVDLDIWNWKDPLIQPMQLVQANRERERTYQAYANTGDMTVVQLATLDIPEVSIMQGDEGDLAIATTNTMVKYGWDVSHDGTYVDVYLMDVSTGEPELILEKHRGRGASASPDGTYLTWWDGDELDYMVMNVATREVRNLTAALPYPVWNEQDDHPDDPGSYGTAGWLQNDAGFLVNDAFDIWQVDPAGRQAPKNLTEGVGRTNDIRFRYVNLDRAGGGGGWLRRRRRGRRRR